MTDKEINSLFVLPSLKEEMPFVWNIAENKKNFTAQFYCRHCDNVWEEKIYNSSVLITCPGCKHQKGYAKNEIKNLEFLSSYEHTAQIAANASHIYIVAIKHCVSDTTFAIESSFCEAVKISKKNFKVEYFTKEYGSRWRSWSPTRKINSLSVSQEFENSGIKELFNLFDLDTCDISCLANYLRFYVQNPVFKEIIHYGQAFIPIIILPNINICNLLLNIKGQTLEDIFRIPQKFLEYYIKNYKNIYFPLYQKYALSCPYSSGKTYSWFLNCFNFELPEFADVNMKTIIKLCEENNINADKLAKYFDNLWKNEGMSFYVSLQNYQEYIDECKKIGRDITIEEVLFPHNLATQLNRVKRERAIKDTLESAASLEENFKGVKNFEYEDDNIIIRAPKTPQEALDGWLFQYANDLIIGQTLFAYKPETPTKLAYIITLSTKKGISRNYTLPDIKGECLRDIDVDEEKLFYGWFKKHKFRASPFINSLWPNSPF